MNILSIGNFFNPSWDGSQPDEEHIAYALGSLGHMVFRWQREEVVEEAFIEFQPDFILIAQWSGFDDDLIPRLKRRYACPVVYWAFDHQDRQQAWHNRLIEGVDLYLSKRLSDGAAYGEKWQWLAQDFAPTFLDRVRPYIAQEIDKDIDVLFTGSYLPWATDRIDILKAVDKRFNLYIYSVTPHDWIAQGFTNVHGPVMDDGLPNLIARTKVNLSIDHTIEAGYWSDRVAQILCCDGLVLHYYQPLCETVFRDTVTYFYNIQDCLDKLDFFLQNNVQNPQSAYEYARDYLKVTNRVKDLLTIVQRIL